MRFALKCSLPDPFMWVLFVSVVGLTTGCCDRVHPSLNTDKSPPTTATETNKQNLVAIIELLGLDEEFPVPTNEILKHVAKCRLIALELGRSNVHDSEVFNLYFNDLQVVHFDPTYVGMRYRLVTFSPLEYVHVTGATTIGPLKDLRVPEGKESEAWSTVAIIEVQEISPAQGSWRPIDPHLCKCKLLSLIRGHFEVNQDEDFDIVCVPRLVLGVDFPRTVRLSWKVHAGFHKTLTKHYDKGGWAALRITELTPAQEVSPEEKPSTTKP